MSQSSPGYYKFSFSATDNPAILTNDSYEVFLFAVDPQTGNEFNYFNSSTAKIVFQWQCKDYSITTDKTTVSFVDRPQSGATKTIQWSYLSADSIMPQLVPSRAKCTRFWFT